MRRSTLRDAKFNHRHPWVTARIDSFFYQTGQGDVNSVWVRSLGSEFKTSVCLFDRFSPHFFFTPLTETSKGQKQKARKVMVK